jgi:hypothetical protein
MINTDVFSTQLYYTNDLPPFSGLKTEEIVSALIIGEIRDALYLAFFIFQHPKIDFIWKTYR